MEDPAVHGPPLASVPGPLWGQWVCERGWVHGKIQGTPCLPAVPPHEAGEVGDKGVGHGREQYRLRKQFKFTQGPLQARPRQAWLTGLCHTWLNRILGQTCVFTWTTFTPAWSCCWICRSGVCLYNALVKMLFVVFYIIDLYCFFFLILFWDCF